MKSLPDLKKVFLLEWFFLLTKGVWHHRSPNLDKVNEISRFFKNVIAWFKFYLSEQKFKINLNNSYYNPLNLICGVSQGSILGPLLFLFYINYLPQPDVNSLLLYAHDTCLAFQHNNVSEIENRFFKFVWLVCW